MVPNGREVGRLGNHLHGGSDGANRIEDGIIAMADHVWAVWCEKHQMFGQTVTVKINTRQLQAGDEEPDIARACRHAPGAKEVSVGLVRSVYPVAMGIRLVGVTRRRSATTG